MSGAQGRPSLCFVAHFAYGALRGGDGGHIGGVERQTSLMARWLAQRGYRVSMVTWDEGQADGVEIDGVRVFKMCREDAGVPGARFVWPRWTGLNAALNRADADVYYHNCGEYVTGQVALWCRRHGRKFVYSVASDPDCDVRLLEMGKLRERVLYRYGLKHADRVIVQTRKQQEMLRTGFGRDSVVIPMPCPGPSDAEYAMGHGNGKGRNHVLWIGRICAVKRPDLLLDLAESCPEVHFDMVGPVDETEYVCGVVARAKTMANVTLHGPASRAQVSEFYKTTPLMCCTSAFEGFPNTFLEAWSYGVPVVSTIDPDNLIAEKGLGCVGTDCAELAAGIRELLGTPELRRLASETARRYYAEMHAVDSAMARFEKAFCEVATVRTSV